MIKSKVWLSLGRTAKDVYLLFRTKCQVATNRGKPGKERFAIINNGELVFTYAEAQEPYGITASRFTRAIDDLVKKGFIDIEQSGMGVNRATTLYRISERWRRYGCSNFVNKTRPRAHRFDFGFKQGNDLWKRKQENITVKNDHSAMRINEHGGILAMRTNAHGQIIKTLYKFSNGQWLGFQSA